MGEQPDVAEEAVEPDEVCPDQSSDQDTIGDKLRSGRRFARFGWQYPASWIKAGDVVDGGINSVRERLRPLIEAWRGDTLLRVTTPVVLTVIVALLYGFYMGNAVWLRHEHFATFDYDLGMYDQGIWQLAHGRGFMTVRGMHVFGHHANLGYLLLVPFYWIGIGGPQFLNIVNLAGVLAVSVPIFALARRHLQSGWIGLGLVVAYLFHFSPQWKIQETFHAESIAAPAVVGAFYFASIGKAKHYWACIAFALIWKEDVALATAMCGLAVALCFGHWRRGLTTFAVSMVWFGLAVKWFLPHFSNHGAVFDNLFGALGANSTELVTNALRHPPRLWRTLTCHGFIDGKLSAENPPLPGVNCPTTVLPQDPNAGPLGLVSLAKPYGYVTTAMSPAPVLLGTPQHVVNSATLANFTWDLRWHYGFFPYLGVLLASVRAVITRTRILTAVALTMVMVVGVYIDREEGVGPWTENYSVGNFALDRLAIHDAYADALQLVGPDDVVSANYQFVPHLSHRQEIYTFPNPWISSNYGVGGMPAPPDPKRVDWLIVIPADLNQPASALLDSILKSGEFEIRRTSRAPGGSLLVLERVGHK